VTLLQLNDVYQFAPVDGGHARRTGAGSDFAKADHERIPHALFPAGRRYISPSVESITYQGRQMIDAWNSSGLDYATFGNHEFDFGPDVLRARMSDSHFKCWQRTSSTKRPAKRLAALLSLSFANLTE